MPNYLEKQPTPNEDIDRAVEKILKKANDAEPDVAVKIINTAIAWEKVKHGIMGKDDEFDPADL